MVSQRHRCIGEALKNAVRLTFPKGARLKEPEKVFNARPDSGSVRAVDFREGEKVPETALKVPETALKALIRDAVSLNA